MDFSCEFRMPRPSVALAIVRGSLDAGTSIEMESALAGYLGKPEVRYFVLDLAQLIFISSSGLRILMIIIKTLARRSGKLYLIGAGEQTIKLITMSGLAKLIFFRGSLDECEVD